MEMVIKIPIDVRQLPPFRSLQAALGGGLMGEMRALFAWFVLWQEMVYRMQDGSVGRVPRCEGALLVEPLKGMWAEKLSVGELRVESGEDGSHGPDDREQASPTSASATEALQQLLLEAKLLKADGDDLICTRFMALYGGGAPGPRTMSQKGGDVRAYNMKLRRVDGDAFQQSLLIADQKFVDDEGVPLDSELTKQVTRLIIVLDNALFKPERPPVGYTEGLIQSALAVVKKFTAEEIDHVAGKVARNRNHPALNGMTCEKLLPMFGEVVGRLEG